MPSGCRVETVFIDLAKKDIRGCVACGTCNAKLECSQDDAFGIDTARNIGRRLASVATRLRPQKGGE